MFGAGQLSQRMQIPGNMWLEVWQSAQPIPARRQRRLFDDTKEAEKVSVFYKLSHHIFILNLPEHFISTRKFR